MPVLDGSRDARPVGGTNTLRVLRAELILARLRNGNPSLHEGMLQHLQGLLQPPDGSELLGQPRRWPAFLEDLPGIASAGAVHTRGFDMDPTGAGYDDGDDEDISGDDEKQEDEQAEEDEDGMDAQLVYRAEELRRWRASHQGRRPQQLDPRSEVTVAAARQAAEADELSAQREQLLLQGPPPCCFLTAGQVFHGVQRLNASSYMARREEADWHLVLRIHECNWEQGKLSGVMEAAHSARDPQDPAGSLPGTVTTYWEADVVDNKHHTFFTDKWDSNHSADLDHWQRMGRQAFTERMRQQVVGQTGVHRGRCTELSTHPYVFLRLKERAFVSAPPPESGLTITGFYFMALARATGSIVGFYADVESTPYQRLELSPVVTNGMQFGATAFA